MGQRPKNNMPRAERAKQFMPFAALRGLDEALAAKEKIVVSQKELSEEMLAELDEKMHQVSKGDMVTVIYYDHEEYLKFTGMVAKLDADAKLLQVVNTKISFDKIYDIEVHKA